MNANKITLAGYIVYLQSMYKHGFILDHRISKAKKLTTRWDARKLINELVKLNKKHPFKLKDIQCSAERLKQYSV